MRVKILLLALPLGYCLLIGCKESSPLENSGLTIGQQLVLSDFLPGCKSLDHFKVYTDLTKAGMYHGEDSDCGGADKGTQLRLVDADLMSTKTVEDVKVAKTIIASGPNKGEELWCTLENLESVTQSSQ